MIKLTSKIKLLLISACYGAMISSPVIAEDIEIYVNDNAGDSDVQANVLFILDTSNSMKNLEAALEPYDATTDYSVIVSPRGTPACFDAGFVYRVDRKLISSVVSFCSPAKADGDLLYQVNGKAQTWVKGAVAMDKFYCARAEMVSAGAEPATSTGQYTGRIQTYSKNNNGGGDRVWRNVNAYNLDAVADCAADYGVHGQTAGGPVYATKFANQDSAWTNVQTEALSINTWNGIGVKNFYTGNYLNYLQVAPGTVVGRIELITDAMADFISTTPGINLGFMPFSQRLDNHDKPSALGGMVSVDIDDIDDTAADIIASMDFYATRTGTNNAGLPQFANLAFGTPLSQAYFEAMNYFKGGPVGYGLNSLPAPSEHHSIVGESHDVPLHDGTLYDSPIADECQKNYIILLTDGAPIHDPLTAEQLTSVGVTDTSCAMECDEGGCDNNCLDELAFAAATTDMSPLPGKQVVSTFAVAFGEDIAILNAAAAVSNSNTGAGESVVTDNAAGISQILKAYVAGILTANSTFSSPAISVNAFNRAVHLDDLYYTLFLPGEGPRWAGNFKKYKLNAKVDSTTKETISFIEDAALNEAIDPSTGFFDKDAISYWSDGSDGAEVVKGGMANKLALRSVYTYIGGYASAGGVLTPTSTEIKADVNLLNQSNASNVTAALLGIDGAENITIAYGSGDQAASYTDTLHNVLLDWAGGIDVKDDDDDDAVDDARREIGDPLHSQPAIIEYGTESTPDLISYVATNDGYLHAIDTDDGTELWSFVPQELLPNLDIVFKNAPGESKNYGLDGDVVSRVTYNRTDGVITGVASAWIYIGMRRGGDKIYAIDVTDKNDPQFKWMIDGGIDGTAYEQLGQTWSSVNVENILDNGISKPVLIFGGGYDVAHDVAGIARGNGGDMGAAIYIADAVTGARIWSASAVVGSEATESIAGLKYSVAARVKPLDMNGDGNTDRLYVADLGGQLFRFDIDESATASAAFSASAIDGGRIADLTSSNGTPNAENSRMFYYPPDAAIVSSRGKKAYIAVAISSGYRAHPLDRVIKDRIYVLKDKDIFDKPASYTTLTESDLYDATADAVSSSNAAEVNTALTALDNADGWYLKMDADSGISPVVGEKGLAEPLIIEGTLVVSTYLPVKNDDGEHDDDDDNDGDDVHDGDHDGDGDVDADDNDEGDGVDDDGDGNSDDDDNSCAPKSGNGRVFYLDLETAAGAYPSDNGETPERNKSLKSTGIPGEPRLIITPKSPTLCVGTECEALGGNVGLRKTFWHEVEK